MSKYHDNQIESINKSCNYIIFYPHILNYAIESIMMSIDRIKINIKYKYLKYVFHTIGKMFERINQHKKDNCFVYHYKSKSNSSIDVVVYSSKFWANIVIHDPSGWSQIKLKHLLLSLIKGKAVQSDISCGQIELALDFIPIDRADLPKLQNALATHLCLKYARKDSRSLFMQTDYFGNKGNVRSGSKGVRVYQSPHSDPIAVRIETQMNKQHLRNRIGIENYPIVVTDFRFQNFFYFREKLSLASQKQLRDFFQVALEHEKSQYRMSKKWVRHFAGHLVREVVKLEYVSDQIDQFRSTCKRLNLKLQMGDFFPVCPWFVELCRLIDKKAAVGVSDRE